MANDFTAVPPLSTPRTSPASMARTQPASTVLSQVTGASQSPRQLSSSPLNTQSQHHRSIPHNAAQLQHFRKSDHSAGEVRKEVITWCEKYWPLAQGDTKIKRIHQLLRTPGKPENLDATELRNALGQIDSWIPGLTSIKHTFDEYLQQADPHMVNWIKHNPCRVGNAEFRLLTLLKRDDRPAGITPKMMRAALLELDLSTAFGRSTISLAFKASKIALSDEMRTWVCRHWSRNPDIPLSQKIQHLQGQPNPPADFDADTVYIALFHQLGENGPKLNTVRQLFNSTAISDDVQQLSLLDHHWRRTFGLTSDRLITLLSLPQMKQWRDINNLLRAMKQLYSHDAPVKHQIRTAVIRVTGGVTDALLSWVAKHWMATSEDSVDVTMSRVEKLLTQPEMPQPVNALMLYSALLLVGSNPPGKSHVFEVFKQHMLAKAAEAQLQLETAQNAQVAQTYQLLVHMYGENILDRASEQLSDPTREQQYKRSDTAAGLAPAVVNKLRRVIPAAASRPPAKNDLD